MPTLSEVHKQISKLGLANILGTKKEVAYLPKVLSEDEEILGLVSGMMDGNTWLVTCTNRRVIFLDKGFFYGLKQSEIPLTKINSIDQNSGFFFGKISIWYGSSKIDMINIKKALVGQFISCVNNAIENLRMSESQNSATQNIGPGEETATDELLKLVKLKEQGILSEEEFLKMKAKIVG